MTPRQMQDLARRLEKAKLADMPSELACHLFVLLARELRRAAAARLRLATKPGVGVSR
jgi:hypothetical protein